MANGESYALAASKLRVMRLTQLTLEQASAITRLHEDGAINIVASTFNINNIRDVIVSELWPEAVPQHEIVTAEPQKLERARNIITAIGSLNSKRFLDYGCGEGHCVTAADEAALALGYDSTAHWEGRTDLTTDFQEIIAQGPYDVILCYDVIDHICDRAAQVTALTNISNLLAPGGVARVRFHPYTSRHATHTYTSLNRAYIHLFLDFAEIQSAGWGCQPVQPMNFPLRYYDALISEAGLTITNRQVICGEVPPLFFQDEIAERLRSNPKNGLKQGFVNYTNLLEIDFVDFTLARSLQQTGNTAI